MKGDFAKGIRLLRYCAEKRSSTVLLILFFLGGLVLETLISIGGISSGEFSPFDPGCVFLICAAMFPSQMLLSMDVSTMVQTSAYKKRLQTSMHAVLLLAGMLAAFTLILILRVAGLLVRGLSFAELDILPVGVFAAFIILYSGFVYKFFVLSVIVLYAVMIAWGTLFGYLYALEVRLPQLFRGSENPAVNIIAGYALMLAAAGIEYLIAQGLYRFPLSKYAFRCTRSRTT